MIERVGIGTVAKVASGNMVPGLPADLEVDDILLCFAAVRLSVGIATPAMDPEWQMPAEYDAGFGILYSEQLLFSVVPLHAVRWLRYTGTPPDTTVNYADTLGAASWIVAYRGCEVEGEPFDSFQLYDSSGIPIAKILASFWYTTPTSVTITYPAMTPKWIGDMVVCSWCTSGQGTNGPILGSDPEVVPVLDDTTALGSGLSFGFADAISTGALPIPLRNSTFSVTGTNTGAIMLLKPKDATGVLSPTAQYAVSRHQSGAAA